MAFYKKTVRQILQGGFELSTSENNFLQSLSASEQKNLTDKQIKWLASIQAKFGVKTEIDKASCGGKTLSVKVRRNRKIKGAKR